MIPWRSQAMEDDYVALGRSIRARREAVGWTQEKLCWELEAKGFPCSIFSLSNYENGKKRMSVLALRAFSKALKVSVDELLRGKR